MTAVAKLLDQEEKELCIGSISYQNLHSLLFYPAGVDDPSEIEKLAAILQLGCTGHHPIHSCRAVAGPNPLHFRLNLLEE